MTSDTPKPPGAPWGSDTPPPTPARPRCSCGLPLWGGYCAYVLALGVVGGVSMLGAVVCTVLAVVGAR